MGWTSLIGPAVVAAGISGLVSSIGIWISTRTARRIHTEKLTFDRDQAERRTTAEIGLTERRAVADANLAERKFVFDKAVVGWRRRYELAERLLTAGYEARDALNWARGRGIFEGEGRTRKALEPEDDKTREARDSAFVPIERLTENAKSFVALQTMQYEVKAHFSDDITKPIFEIMEVHRKITSTASMMMRLIHVDGDPMLRQQLVPFRTILYGDRPDDLDRKVESAITQLEAICKPVLAEGAPS